MSARVNGRQREMDCKHARLVTRLFNVGFSISGWIYTVRRRNATRSRKGSDCAVGK